MRNQLRKKEFNGNQHHGDKANASLCILLRSLIEEGCFTPTVLWVNPESDNGFNTKPGKTRFQMYQGFHKLFDLPVVIIDPYRTSDSRKLISTSFSKAHRTAKQYDFKLKYNPKKNNHEMVPIFDNITNTDLHAKVYHEHPDREFFVKKYQEAHTPGFPGLKVYMNNELIYQLGNQKTSIDYHVEYSYEAWYAFAEYMGILTHEEILDLKSR
jgi:hypothetical protein